MKKTHLYTALVVLTLTTAHNAQAQLLITESFMLKNSKNEVTERDIRNSLYQKGVRNTEWDEETRLLTITYDPKKVSFKDLRQKAEALAAGQMTADVGRKRFRFRDLFR